MTATIETPAQFIDALEKFQQVYDYHWEHLNETGTIDKSIAEGLELRAKMLQQAAARVLPAGKNKDQILRHLAWSHQHAHGWAALFAAA